MNLSQYHFDRLFTIIVGTRFKQYILGRKLTLAAERLISSTDNIIDIALDLDFKYPEVFSRAFKKQFGISPKAFRKEKVEINKVDKAIIVPRDFMNYNGGVTLKATNVKLDNIELQGVSATIDVYDYGFEGKLKQIARNFSDKSREYEYLKQDKLYYLVNCHGEGTSTYTVYFGKEVIQDKYSEGFTKRTIPKSQYARFLYEGKMSKVRTTFEDDLFRWIALKDIKLNAIGIGMISIYDESYYKKGLLKILVPVVTNG